MFLQRIRNRGIQLGTLFERAAKKHPENILILDHDLDIAPHLGRRPNMVQIADLIDDIASRLVAGKVRTGQHVVIYKSDGFDITLLACAVARIGAIPVLPSPKLDGETVAELASRVSQLGPIHLITDQHKLDNELPASVFASADGIFLCTGTHPAGTALASLADAPRVPAVRMPPSHPTLVTHTSGTTGIPKLAVHTGWTLQARYRPQASVAALVRKRRTVAIHISFVHSRLFTALAITMLRGFPLIILADDDPEHVAEIFSELRPGVLEAHPNTFMRWEELADDPREPLANVKYFNSTFDAIHPRTVRRMLGASRHRAPVFGQLYGQSEVGPIVGRGFTRRRALDADGRCVGVPFLGMTNIRVVSRGGQKPSESTPGYIEVKTDGRILTYLGEQDRYDKQADGGWWRMGDVGYRTKWGCLHLLDREVDLIPGFGSTLAAEDGTAVPVVCTRNDKPLDRTAWDAAVHSLPAMGEPVHWRLADLPQTATTKIKRIELARLLAAGSQRH